MMIHDFDMARFVTGSEVVEVYAQAAVRVDPAIGAGPFLTTTTDVLGFFSFLGLATLFLL